MAGGAPEKMGETSIWRTACKGPSLILGCVFFFFFQAEDGIRDADVTGVQTCALPILFTEHDFLDRFAAAADAGFRGVEYLFPYAHSPEAISAALRDAGLEQVLFNLPQIGRASCREREEISGVAVSVV